MSESEWLTSTDPAAMLQWRTHFQPRSEDSEELDRKLRLFACACCRLRGAADEIVDGYEKNGPPEDEDAGTFQREMGFEPYNDAMWAQGWTERGQNKPTMEVRATLLREIFGNPFDPVVMPYGAYGTELEGVRCDGACTPAVIRIAQAIYDERAFDRMPVLADALEESDCRVEAILRHCRGEEPRVVETNTAYLKGHSESMMNPGKVEGWRTLRGPHVRGCFVLDLILGKE